MKEFIKGEIAKLAKVLADGFDRIDKCLDKMDQHFESSWSYAFGRNSKIKTKPCVYSPCFFWVRTHHWELPQRRLVADEGGDDSGRAEHVSNVPRTDRVV